MPLKFDIKREFSCSSERIKSIEFHPTEPLLLSSLYTGHIQLWNYKTNQLEKNLAVTESANTPVRCAKFIARKQWFACCSDDMIIRVFDLNTMRKIRQWEAHSDYIRCLVIHPNLPYIISSSDDMTIKIWDWDKNFAKRKKLKGHCHYVMNIDINPNNLNTFASASLDGSIKIWSLTSNEADFTLKGHDKGVNCVRYFKAKDKPFLVSGGDDFKVKVWDYLSKQCIATLTGHTSNLSSVEVHPIIPLIISGSEDGTLRLWHSNTFRAETTLDYGLDRVWAISSRDGGARVAVGFDYGAIVLQLGEERPIFSMDLSGNAVWFDNYSLFYANVKTGSPLGEKSEENLLCTGEKEVVPVDICDLGNCDLYPQVIRHSPNGRVISIIGDNQYSLRTSRKMKNIAFGSAKEFVWSFDSKIFAVRQDGYVIKIFFENKERKSFKTSFPPEEIFGGHLLGVRSAEFIDFFDWESLEMVKRLPYSPSAVIWSESGAKMVLVTDRLFAIFSYDEEENRLEKRAELKEKIVSGHFAGDYCFLFVTANNALKYFVGEDEKHGEVIPLARTSSPLFIMGYLQGENKVFLMDKEHRIFAYWLNAMVLGIQIDVIMGDITSAKENVAKIPKCEHSKLSKFLQSQNYPRFALEIATDKNNIFDLALQLGELELAHTVAREIDSKIYWKKLGEEALKRCDLSLAEECALITEDYGLLMLICICLNKRDSLEKLYKLVKEKQLFNIAFLALSYLGRPEEAVNLLLEEGLHSQAALFAKTYCPSDVAKTVKIWNEKNGSLFEFECPENVIENSSDDLIEDHGHLKRHVTKNSNTTEMLSPNGIIDDEKIIKG